MKNTQFLDTSNVESVLNEFHRLAAESSTNEACNFLRPFCHLDMRFALEFAASALSVDLPFEAMAVLMPHYSIHKENSWYVAVLTIVLEQCKNLTSTIISEVNNNISHVKWSGVDSNRIPEIERHFELSLSAGVAPSELLIAEYSKNCPQSRSPLEITNLAPAHFIKPAPIFDRSEAISIPDPRVFYEDSTSANHTFSIGASSVDRSTTEFIMLHDVRLYMLPGMYGLIEIKPGTFYANSPIGSASVGESHLIRSYNNKLFVNASHYSNSVNEQIIENPVLLPFRLSGSYYFHFVVETLQAIRDAGAGLHELEILLPDADGFFNRVSRYVYEEAANAVMTKHQRPLWLSEGVYRLRTVYVPAAYQYCNINIQDVILPLSDPGEGNLNADNIIYISRRESMVRAVQNNSEVAKSIKERFPNSETVYLENLTFLEQVAVFRRAAIVIGPHGGGMTNILFCKPNTSIIEFQMPGQGIMYSHIAYSLGLRYTAYVPEMIDRQNEGFVINCNKLTDLIASELENGGVHFNSRPS